MNVQDVITALENKGAVLVYQGESFATSDVNDNLIFDTHRVYYQEPISDTENSEPRTIELQQAKDSDLVKYKGPKPALLQDAPIEPVERPHLMTDAEIVTGINAIDTLINDTKFKVRVDGAADVVTARVLDTKDGLATTAQYIVFDNKGKIELKKLK